MKKRTGRDIEAQTEAAWGRLDEDALLGQSVEAPSRWCQARRFRVLVEEEGGASALSRNANRVRLKVRDGIVIQARLG